MNSATQDVSPFRTWNGLDSFELFPGVRLHAIGGDQVLICGSATTPASRSPGTRMSTPSR